MTRHTVFRSIFIAVATIGAVGTGALVWSEAKTTIDQAAALTAPPAMPVDIAVVKRSPVRLWSEFSARLQAVERVELRPQVSGAITEVRFEDGARVQKGDILFVIEPGPYEAAVNEAAADLAAARDRHAHAEKEYRRARSLIGKGAIPERVHDERANAFTVTRSEVTAAEARLRRARIDLEHAFVKAPISGRVSRAEITVGNLVQAGVNAPLLTSIVSDEEIYADFEVDERTYLQFVQAGALNLEAEQKIPVKLEVGGEAALEVEGYIHTFDNRIDPATGTIRARALFARTSPMLLPGMFARVKLGTASPQPAIVLPESAILTDQDRKFVYVIDGGNMATYRQVTLGATVAGKRVVTSGLSEGDRVITSNLMIMRPNAPVAPKAVAKAETAATVSR